MIDLSVFHNASNHMITDRDDASTYQVLFFLVFAFQRSNHC